MLTHTDPQGRMDRVEFAWRAAIVIALLAAVVLICYAAEVLLLAFGAVLFSILLDFLANRLAGMTGLARRYSFGCVLLAVVVIAGAAAWIAVPRAADQVSQFVKFMPKAFERLTTYLQGREWGQTVLIYLPSTLSSINVAAIVSTAVRRAVSGAIGFVVFAVVGIFVAANPGLYQRGVLKLFPHRHRARVREVFRDVAYSLRWWIFGQLVPMTVLGIASVIGFSLLHMRLAFTLGLFTGLMVFIPYIGALIAYTVTVPLALLQGPEQVLNVSILFIGVHLLEGYVITPLIQRRAVYLPPGLTIISQVLMGLLLGVLGIAFATPLTAAVMVIVERLYLDEEPARHESS